MLREIFHPCVPALVACSNIAPETPGLWFPRVFGTISRHLRDEWRNTGEVSSPERAKRRGKMSAMKLLRKPHCLEVSSSPGFSERYHATCVMSGETQGRILRRNVRRDGVKWLK